MEMADQIRYSIVIPLYNEEENIGPLYSRIVAAMVELSGNYEIVFVDDGSRDQTFKILSEL
jgi:polyisoprenyl-phosphate glycosyltransferase